MLLPRSLVFVLLLLVLIRISGGAEPLTPVIPPPVTHAYKATVVAVHDGDTVSLDIALAGTQGLLSQPVRLLGVFAAELNAPGGPACRDNLLAMLPPGSKVIVQISHTSTGNVVASFGRVIGRIWRAGAEGTDINAAQGAWLVEHQLWGGNGSIK